MGMHNELEFPIECSFQHAVFGRYAIDDKSIIRSGKNPTIYEAMDNIDLIPSLVALVNKKGKRIPAIRQWVKTYGLLTVPMNSNDREDTDVFWDKATHLVNLWGLYQKVVNKDLEGLKQVVLFTDEREDDGCDNFLVVPGRPTAGHVFSDGIPARPTYRYSGQTPYFKVEIEEINKDPLRYYQYTAFHYVRRIIENELVGGANLSSKSILTESVEGKDFLKATPVIKPRTLLHAMYLQFYIFLNSSNKKICANCGRIFVPDRSDQIYCPPPSPCKNTAKSRRYRDRKKIDKPVFKAKGSKKREANNNG